MIANDNQWIKIGVVGKAHGLNGAFYVSGRDEPIPASYKNLMIGKSFATAIPCKIKGIKQQGPRSIIRVSSSQSRNSAESLSGFEIFVEKSCIPITDDEFLWDDLHGKELVDSAGRSVGTIESVQNLGASDFARIISSEYGVLEIPVVNTYFDMSFATDPLQLVVNLDTFEGLWSKT